MTIRTTLCFALLCLQIPTIGVVAQTPAAGELNPASQALQGSDELEVARINQLLDEIAPGADDEAPSASETSSLGWPSSPDAAAVAQALAEYADTGEPPILGLPTARVYPFGHEVPVVRCLPLRACDLVFEAGEGLTGWALGDSERWLAEELLEGRGETARPHLLLKPTGYHLATNLVVVTDRRTYRLELESPSHDEVHDNSIDGPLAAYDISVGWWYPDDFVHRIRARETATATAATLADARHREAVSLGQPFDPVDLSFAYVLERPWLRSRRLPWEPVTVFDDGRSVYLRLPDAARRSDLPVVLGLLGDGSHYPLAARLEGDWLIVPSLFERAQLVLGTGKHQRRLTIVAEGR